MPNLVFSARRGAVRPALAEPFQRGTERVRSGHAGVGPVVDADAGDAGLQAAGGVPGLADAGHDDAREGIAANLEKRKPAFKGR